MSAGSIDIYQHTASDPPVRGFLHRPDSANGKAIVLTHGAGSNCRAPLLVAVAEGFAATGFLVLRCDLPFRQVRSFGPPRPGDASGDRAGLERAVELIRKETSGAIFLGGHSYGGRQASMLAAEKPEMAQGLLLLSYPLHPPRKPEQLRTAHFLKLTGSALFVHGTRDPFATPDELRSALTLIPAKTRLLEVEGAGHDLGFKGKSFRAELPRQIGEEFLTLFG